MVNKNIKAILFEIYSAGFEAGYSQNKSLKKSFDEYYKRLIKEMENENKR